jgi:hypothetical protein
MPGAVSSPTWPLYHPAYRANTEARLSPRKPAALMFANTREAEIASCDEVGCKHRTQKRCGSSEVR